MAKKNRQKATKPAPTPKLSRTKFLTDTSALPAATGYSIPEHIEAFAVATANGSHWTSIYIRKEFLRRFICDTISMAIAIKQCTSSSHALDLLSQDFSARRIKTSMTVFAKILKDRGAFEDTNLMAEEVASVAMQWLEHFDRVFVSRIPNACGCEIGSKNPNVDYNDLLYSLHKFYIEIHTNITDCKINSYIGIPTTKPRVRGVQDDQNASKEQAVVKLEELISTPKRKINCKNCSSIGDLVIALEQPRSWTLVHIDNSFDALCGCLKSKHKKIDSMRKLSNVILDPLKLVPSPKS